MELKNIFCSIIILYFGSVCAQSTFEGVITFDVLFIQLNESESNELFEKKHKTAIGDQVEISYSKFGHIKQKFIHSKKDGIEYYLNLADGKRFKKIRDGSVMPVDPKTTFLGKFQGINDTILGLPCKCYDYKYVTDRKIIRIETYCYNENTPHVNPKLFRNITNKFEKDFFENTERPFIKYTFATPKYKMVFIAKSIEIKDVPIEEFIINGS